MSPMLRINITIPSDLYEECQQACEKQKISFSQLVRTALINHLEGGFSIQSTQSEEEIKKIVNSTLISHLSTLQQRMTDIEENIYVLQKLPVKPSSKKDLTKKPDDSD